MFNCFNFYNPYGHGRIKTKDLVNDRISNFTHAYIQYGLEIENLLDLIIALSRVTPEAVSRTLLIDPRVLGLMASNIIRSAWDTRKDFFYVQESFSQSHYAHFRRTGQGYLAYFLTLFQTCSVQHCDS